MTTQQENYIESRLEDYYEKSKAERIDDIESAVLSELEILEEKEREIAEQTLHGAALESHMKHFIKEKEKELFDSYMEEFELEMQEELNQYRDELLKEIEE